MGAFFTAILGKIVAIAKWIGDLFVAVFKALYDLLADVMAWTFEQLMDVVLAAISVLDFSAIETALGTFGQIPAMVLEVMAATGLGTALSVIGVALIARMGLQLIPFVRLGS